MLPRKSLRLLAVAMTAASTPLIMMPVAFADDDGMEWQFSEFNDPDNKGRLTARLIFGVPETDNIQVSGVCDGTPSTSARFSSVTFGADTGDLREGAEVDLRFSGGGFDHVMRGAVYGTQAEEGVSGIRLDIEHNDSLWDALLEKDSIDYLVAGYRANALDLTRGKDKIKSFVEACRAYAKSILGDLKDDPGSQRATQSGGVSEKEAPNISCKKLGKIRSKNSNTPAKITFVNRSGMHRAILWLDFKGNPKTYAALNSGQRVTLDTYLTHPWMITDGPGNCIQIVMPGRGAKVVTLGGAKAAPPPRKRKKSKKRGCRRGYVSIEGKCILKQDAASYCGPGYRLQGNKCVFGYKAPKPQKQRPSWQIEAIKKGCAPGLAWNPQEGCHEND